MSRLYRPRPAQIALRGSRPEYDFVSQDGIRHILWVVEEPQAVSALQNAFKKINPLYVADGHHRSAATRVKQMRQASNPQHSGEEEYNYFLAVIFPHNHMQILDYNRVVKDLHGHSREDFLKKVSEKFEVEKVKNNQPHKPGKAHEFWMYLPGQWYKLAAKPGPFTEAGPVRRLDVSILQENLLAAILGISDPRKDKRIDFVGGIRGLKELQKRVDSGECAAAFALYPTSIEDLMAIADAGKIMPPKST